MVPNSEKENITEENDKNLMKQYVRAFDPKGDQGWNLISNKQKMVQLKR